MKTRKHLGKSLLRVVMLVLGTVMAFSAVACGGSGDNGDNGGANAGKVYASIYVSKGGYGTTALEKQAARFADAFADKIYTDADGIQYKGAQIQVRDTGTSVSPSMGNVHNDTTYLIHYASTEFTGVAGEVGNGGIVDIDSIMRTQIPGDPEGSTILSKLADNVKYALTDGATDGTEHYYGFPFAERSFGLIYDRELFSNNGYFLVKEGGEAYDSEILEGVSYSFGKENKTVGPDGVPGSVDDGMPSSLYEFIVLCEKIKNDGIAPFMYPGGVAAHTNFIAQSMLYSLLGAEKSQGYFDIGYQGDDFTVVTNFTSDDLFMEGVDGVVAKVPETVEVKFDESSGFYSSMSVERYYVMALLDLMEAQGWFSPIATDINANHTDTQKAFILSNLSMGQTNQAAMLMDASFWYNESVDAGNWTDYRKFYRQEKGVSTDNNSRDIAIMPLPINIKTSVTGEGDRVYVEGIGWENTKGEKYTRVVDSEGAIVVNKFFEDMPEMMEVAKDYLLFITSDAELSRFAADAGYTVMLNFNVDKEVFANVASAKYPTETMTYFKENTTNVYRWSSTYSRVNSTNSQAWLIGYGSWDFGNSPYTGAVTKTATEGAVKQFALSVLYPAGGSPAGTSSNWDWSKLYKRQPGQEDAPVTYYQYPETHAKAGQNVVFTRDASLETA